MLSPETSPYLAERKGDDIVTASGTTLLGADDKAGVAIVMTMARHLLAHPEIAHGPIRIAFTPDEEIGRGVHADLPRDLAADVAYTLDGAERGEIVFESFSADKAVVRIEGVSIHPGVAKGKLVNALHLAAKIVDTLPHATLTPETTAGREGFLHVYEMSGTAAAAELRSSCATSSATASPPTARWSTRSAPPSRPASRARRSPAPSPRSTATCATGSRTTCARSSSPSRPAARPASSPSPRRSAAAPTARA